MNIQTSNLPKISIITPSYNQGAFLEQTIQSVLDQGYPNLEYIIIDGGSKDQTLKILEKYKNHISLISEHDRGQTHAINKGLQRATGDVVAYLNSDDLYTSGSLHIVGQYFEQHPKSVCLTGRCHIIDAHGNIIRKPITNYKNFWMQFSNFTILLIMNYISQPATFWRRQIINDIGYLNENLHYAMDYDYWIRIWQRYSIHHISDYLASFRFHQNSKSGTLPVRLVDEEMEIAKQYASDLIVTLGKNHKKIFSRIYRLLSKLSE